MSNVVLFNPSDDAYVTFDWSDVLGSTLTLGGVVHSLPTPLVNDGENIDQAHGFSQVKIKGAIHGAIYQIAGSATLSNGENINRVFPIRAINS